MKTLGASLIISISKFNYQDLYSFSTSIINDYIDVFLNSKNYHDDNNNNNVTSSTNTNSNTKKNMRRNTAATNTNKCGDIDYHNQILPIPFNTTATITIQKSYHSLLITVK